MKQIKFLLSLAVALLIVVPVLAQDGWSVNGDASFTYLYKIHTPGSDDPNEDNVVTSAVDDTVINVNFTNGGDISPYIKMQYDKGDENRFWIGGTFKKGNFSGEANVKIDEDYNDVDDNGSYSDGDDKWLGASVDAANVTYTLGAAAFTWDKGGKWSNDNSFKVKYTLSDTMSAFVQISESAPIMLEGATTTASTNGDAYKSPFPLVTVGGSLTAGMLTVNAETSYASITITDENATAGDDMAGVSYMFFEVNADVTAKLAEDMSVKVYGGYGINLDAYGTDSGYNDDDYADATGAVTDLWAFEAPVENATADGVENSVSMKFGVEATAFNATVTADFKMIDPAVDKDAAGDFVNEFYMKQSYALAYALKIQELTITPKVAYTIYGENYSVAGSDAADVKGTDLEVSLKTSVAF